LARLDELLLELALGGDIDQRADPRVWRLGAAHALVDDVDHAAVAAAPAIVRSDGPLGGLRQALLERFGIAADDAVAPAQLAGGQCDRVIPDEEFEISAEEPAIEAPLVVEAGLVERERQGFENGCLPQLRLLQLALDRESLGVGVKLGLAQFLLGARL